MSDLVGINYLASQLGKFSRNSTLSGADST